MGDKERAGVKKLMDNAYFIALKGRPFTDFKDHIKHEKLHKVKFDTNSYENETACREFIKTIAFYFFWCGRTNEANKGELHYHFNWRYNW